MFNQLSSLDSYSYYEEETGESWGESLQLSQTFGVCFPIENVLHGITSLSW